jgi:hypothetical protein
MKRIFIIITVIFVFCLSQLLSQIENSTAISKNFFIENKGQWPDEVKFRAKTSNANSWITDKGIVFDYYQIEKGKNFDKRFLLPQSHSNPDPESGFKIKGHVVKMSCLNSNSDKKSLGLSKVETYHNYFLGNDPAKWASHVPLYNEVKSDNIYEGIDKRIYFDKGNIRYDFIVHPWADPGKINIVFEGQKGLRINKNGDLVVETSIGDVINGEIFAYQEIDGEKVEVKCSFQKNDNNTVSFKIDNYDKSEKLIIDPVINSTFIGGSDQDLIFEVRYHKDFVYITGRVSSSDFPIKTGAYDGTFNGQTDSHGGDIIISKLDKNLQNLIFSTYLGGVENDGAVDMAIESWTQTNNNFDYIAVCGWTNSYTFPVTSDAFQKNKSSYSDAFVSILNIDGSKLLYSSFLGGDSWDECTGMVFHDYYSSGRPSRSALLYGTTYSSDFPTSYGAYQRNRVGTVNSFVTSLDANVGGFTLASKSTYVGSINTDKLIINDVYPRSITGDFLFTGCWYFNKCYECIFCSIDNNLSTVNIRYYTDTTSNSCGYYIRPNKSGTYAMFGLTDSDTLYTTSNAYRTSKGGTTDYFLMEVNDQNYTITYSTYVGGKSGEGFYGGGDTVTWRSGDLEYREEIDSYYITGFTYSDDLFLTNNALQDRLGGYDDSFFMIFDRNKFGYPTYSTYIGGSNSDAGWSFDYDRNSVYMAGVSYSTDFPITPNGYQKFIKGSYDGFILQFDTLAPYSIVLEAGKASGRAGDIVEVPIYLRFLKDISQSGVTAINTDLSFNSTLLESLNYNSIGISNGMITISMKGLPITPDANGEIARVKFHVGLGNSTQTNLVLLNSTTEGGYGAIGTIDGLFNLTNICQEGGPRLVNPNTNSGLNIISINPISSNIEIEYQLNEKGRTEIIITNLIGDVVKNIVLDEPKIGNNSMNLETDNLSNGIYFITLQTPTFSETQKLIIIK